MPDEIKQLLPTDIVADKRLNSRDSSISSFARDMTDAELEASIREVGLLQAVRVRMRDGHWTLVFGFRRLAACLRVAPTKKISCSVMPTTGDTVADDLRARYENLAENGPRLANRPHELARYLYDIHQEHRASFKEMAERVGLSEVYVTRLVRLRKQLSAELWDEWARNPDRFQINDLLEVCSKPAGDQVDEYNHLRKARKGGRPKGSRTSKPVNQRDVATWKDEVEEAARLEKDPAKKAFLRGAHYALVAAETGEWSLKGAK